MIVSSSKFNVFVEDSIIKISDDIGFEVTESVLNWFEEAFRGVSGFFKEFLLSTH